MATETVEMSQTAREALMSKVDSRWTVRFKHWEFKSGRPKRWSISRQNSSGKRVWWDIGETELYQLSDAIADAIENHESHAARKRSR